MMITSLGGGPFPCVSVSPSRDPPPECPIAVHRPLVGVLRGVAVSHPLIDLANDREVRQAAGFRDAAAKLTGASLREAFEAEKTNAPQMQEAGRRYFGKRTAKPPTERKKNRDIEHRGAAR